MCNTENYKNHKNYILFKAIILNNFLLFVIGVGGVVKQTWAELGNPSQFTPKGMLHLTKAVFYTISYLPYHFDADPFEKTDPDPTF